MPQRRIIRRHRLQTRSETTLNQGGAAGSATFPEIIQSSWRHNPKALLAVTVQSTFLDGTVASNMDYRPPVTPTNRPGPGGAPRYCPSLLESALDKAKRFKES